MRVQRKILSRLFLLLPLAVLLSGCGSSGEPGSSPQMSAASSEAKSSDLESDVAANEAAPGGAIGAGAPKKSSVPRKIIYTAEVSLVVEKLTPAQQKLLALVRKHGGYIAETNIGGETGAPRTGRWKIRVPVDGYQNFLDAVTKVGEVQTVTSNSSDVSEEFYDIEARLRNKRLEEKRLLEHLNRSTAKLSDILLIEKEISRVRGEIEQMQGRLRVLANLSSLTTVTVTINEIKDYVPPAPPTFGTQIARSFQASFGGLINFGKGAIIAIAAVFPWFVVIAIIAIPIWIFRRRKPKPTTDN